MMRLLILTNLCFFLAGVSRAAEPHPGAAIYAKQCAKCHGAKGEGTKKYEEPLIGKKTVAELVKIIASTMPEDNVGSCTGKDAEAVAQYMHETFYSPEARERNNPTRIELARLTVNQYRQSVADLVGSFRPISTKRDDRHGLQGEYYKGRRFNRQDRVEERLDPDVQFNLGTNSPVPGKIDAKEFSIRWEGSILAPETGDYEFIVHSDHAVRLFVNNNAPPLIDRWVKSGTDTEFKASIYLVGGRYYPIRLEFTKAKQGVDDSKTNKDRPVKPAFIRLNWALPHSTPQPIPARYFSPSRASEVYVVSTPFPPDDRSYGWERGTTVSKAWDAATTDAAIETMHGILAKQRELTGVSPGDPKADSRLREFAARFAERAFRRPLSADVRALYVDRQFQEAKNPVEALKRVILLVLKSPRFLYREVDGAPDAYDVASRLSFMLWDSIPDKVLLDAAAKGQLSQPEQVRSQAERMISDPRAKRKLRGFLHHWLNIDKSYELTKDPKRFPDFDAATVADLRSSLDLFLDDVVWSEASDFRELLLSKDTYLNGRLAKVYGADLPAEAGFQRVKLNADQRAGVLTHPYLMANFAYSAESSPIHRGVFLARGILGLTLRPPQDAFLPLPADLHPTLTTRERVALQTKGANCMSCHKVINPLGFTLEHFDAIGRYRVSDNKKPVDATGDYVTKAGEEKSFRGAGDLAAFLVSNPDAHTSFVEQLFHHLVQQSVRAYGLDREAELTKKFTENRFHIRKLAIDIVVTAALTPRR